MFVIEDDYVNGLSCNEYEDLSNSYEEMYLLCKTTLPNDQIICETMNELSELYNDRMVRILERYNWIECPAYV